MSQSSASASPIGSPFAVVIMFFGYGFVMASSYSRMPGIRDQLGCTPTQLAFALVCMGVGSILGMPFAGRLVDNRGASPALGALTFAGFNLTMALGRFTGGVVIQRYGRAPVLRVSGVLACTGVAALCLVNSTLIALLGALAWGLGLSVVFPAAMSAAGEVPGRGARAIAVVATIGYGGFLLGAPLIGLLAHTMPLDRALLAVAVLVLLVAILASVAREHSKGLVKSKD